VKKEFTDHDLSDPKVFAHAQYEPSTVDMNLSEIEHDLDVMVRCVRDLGNDANPNGRPYHEHKGDLETFRKTFDGKKPLYFLNDTYVHERHTQVHQMVARDEAKYGSNYPKLV
jgi:hypothetical protein